MAYLQDVYAANMNAVCHIGGELHLQPHEEWAYREHSFVQNKFYYITGGRCAIVIDGKRYIGTAGDWFFIPAGTRHRYNSFAGEPLEKYWIHFDLYPNADISALLGLPYVVHVEADDVSRELFRELTECNGRQTLTDRLNAKACLLKLVARYVALADSNEVMVSGDESERLQQLLAYIHEHLDERLCNNDLAAQCHMHPTHFIRYFRTHTGQTPARYITERRMESAKRMLEDTALDVAAIMERVGLQEPSHFARLFRKQYALTPSEYRREFRKEQKNAETARFFGKK